MSILVDLVREDFGISGSGKWWRSDIHSSLVVDSEKDYFYFNSRGLRGTPVDYLQHVRGIKRANAEILVRNHLAIGTPIDPVTSIQAKFDKLVDIFFSNGKSIRKYWYEKGINDSTIERFKLGHYDGWYLIPIYDNGKFVNFQCRRSEPAKAMKFWYEDRDFKQVLFNSSILKYVSSVYITEGMVDCLMLNQLGLSTVCSTNGNMSWSSDWINKFSRVSEIVYIADNDEAGVTGAIRTSKFLGTGRVKILRFKEERKGYGALDFFLAGGTVDELKSIVSEKSVYAFEKELV